ncbi:MAG: TonB-dependent receptor domain-containing protein, partial [Luteimonas sp.]
VNIGFTNVMFGYTAIANPDLRPETSDGLEAGIRFAGDAVHAGLTGYHNRYDDFIESFRFVGVNDQGLMVFQSQNVAEARIYGAELKAGVDLGVLSATWQGWSLRGAAAFSRGEDRTAGLPLDSVDPLTATLGLAYAGDAWGAELAGRFVAKKDRVSDPELYRTPGYGVLDLYAHWNFAPGARVNAGLLNLADRRYWAAGDLPLVAATSGVLDRFTSPGRSVAVSVSVEF